MTREHPFHETMQAQEGFNVLLPEIWLWNAVMFREREREKKKNKKHPYKIMSNGRVGEDRLF